MKSSRSVTVWACDQCGYVIEECRDEAQIGKKHVMLTVRGKTYHFHGGDEALGRGIDDLPPWHTRSCLSRWLIAQDHLMRGAEAVKKDLEETARMGEYFGSERDAEYVTNVIGESTGTTEPTTR